MDKPWPEIRPPQICGDILAYGIQNDVWEVEAWNWKTGTLLLVSYFHLCDTRMLCPVRRQRRTDAALSLLSVSNPLTPFMGSRYLVNHASSFPMA